MSGSGATTWPAVRRVALTDLSAVVGALLWGGAVLGGGLGPIERALALALLVLVPLGVGMAATPPFEGLAGRFLTAAVVLQPLGAGLVLASLLLDGPLAALAASVWVLVTGLLGLAALARTLDRGRAPLPELVIDAGLAYPTVGAVALVLFHLGLTLWFDPVIVLLTAIHFHYAGFVLPLLTGLTGREVGPGAGPVFRVAASVVLVGPALIAVGISFSPVVEVVAVGGFTAAVAALGGYVLVRVVPARPRPQGVLLGLSAAALPLSMLLALGYGVAAFTGADPFGQSLSTMVALHGSLNAFGFALCGVVGWRLAVPAARAVDGRAAATVKGFQGGRRAVGMHRKRISSGTEWEERVGYSRAVRVGDRVHVSGTTATDDAGDIVGAGDPAAQTRQALANVEAALERAGAGIEDVVRTRLFVTDIDDWEAIGEVHGEVFGDVRPATTMVEVARLIDPALVVEVEADAVVE
jgi:enamine deaminase RidA (YjgF/YER057c/UK114 family)